jgi:hypothetical protein
MPDNTFKLGKVRGYRCSCGAIVARKLTGEVDDCEGCENSLEDKPFMIEDFNILLRGHVNGEHHHLGQVKP